MSVSAEVRDQLSTRNERIAAECATGMTLGEVAERFGLSARTVRKVVVGEVSDVEKWRADMHARNVRICEMFDQGVPPDRIAAEFGLAVRQVHIINNKARVSRRWTPERDDELLRLFALGHSFAQIATAIGVTKNMAVARRWRLAKEGDKRALAARPEAQKSPAMIKASDGVVVRFKPHPLSPEAKRRQSRVMARFSASRAHEGALLVPMHNLGNGCKWPFDGDGRTLFCGAKTKPGASYCLACAPRAYRVREAGE
jgi:DNA-binding CsgD family transcriptional regulator